MSRLRHWNVLRAPKVSVVHLAALIVLLENMPTDLGRIPVQAVLLATSVQMFTILPSSAGKATTRVEARNIVLSVTQELVLLRIAQLA